MPILLNSAGASAADPALNGLSGEFVFGCSTMDVASVTGAWLDQNATFPGTNSILGSLSPANTVITAGVSCSYDDTTKQYLVSSTTGIVAGDYWYLSGPGVAAGIYKILTIVDATHFTLVNNVANGGGNRSGISYQVAWRYIIALGTAPSVSSGGGTQNYPKFQVQDAVGNQSQTTDFIYIENAPGGVTYITIQGGNYTGNTVNVLALTLAVLSSFTNHGGISNIAFANHSVQTVNNFTFGDATTAEKTYAAAVASGLKVPAGDGLKYGRLLFKSLAGSANSVGVDISLNLDTTPPTIVLAIFGR